MGCALHALIGALLRAWPLPWYRRDTTDSKADWAALEPCDLPVAGLMRRVGPGQKGRVSGMAPVN